jgi:hypothetical protein
MDRAGLFGTLVAFFTVAAIGYGLGFQVADPSVECVPGYAVDYDGTLGAWLDRDGKVVLLAENEDTFDWCVTR